MCGAKKHGTKSGTGAGADRGLMEDAMPLFKLRPVAENLTHPDWARSTHTDECHVSAENEREAREFAKAKFDIAASKPTPSALVSTSPWLNSDLVECKDVAHLGGDMPPHGTVLIPR